MFRNFKVKKQNSPRQSKINDKSGFLPQFASQNTRIASHVFGTRIREKQIQTPSGKEKGAGRNLFTVHQVLGTSDLEGTMIRQRPAIVVTANGGTLGKHGQGTPQDNGRRVVVAVLRSTLIAF